MLLQEEPHLLIGDRFTPDHVIGLRLGEHAKAYPYRLISQAGLINDTLGPYPVLVYADPVRMSVHTYLRTVAQRVLSFERRAGRLIDQETRSTWDPARGLAREGSLRGMALRSLPHVTAYERAWRDFYPRSQWYPR